MVGLGQGLPVLKPWSTEAGYPSGVGFTSRGAAHG